jgi:hypothetical protein
MINIYSFSSVSMSVGGRGVPTVVVMTLNKYALLLQSKVYVSMKILLIYFRVKKVKQRCG